MPPNRVQKLMMQPTGGNPEGGCGTHSNPRREFSARTRRQAWERANGFCEGMVPFDCGHAPPIFARCMAPLTRGRYQYDHIDPDWFSKDNELENCQVLCTRCHKDKTAGDIKHIAKSKRIIDRGIKARVAKHPMPGSKTSGWKKTFNHGWVKR